MVTISQAVTSIINQKPFLSEALGEGIINLSSLARQIQPEVEAMLQIEIQTSAVVMALKRYSPVVDVMLNAKLMRFVKSVGDIIVRSDLSDYTFKNSDELFDKHTKLLKHISGKREIFYTFVQGVFETTLVISNLVKDELEKNFEGEKMLAKSDNLSAVTLKLPYENTLVPGFYYFILRRIAWEGINLYEVISTTNEFTVVVKDEDVDKTFSVMKNLKR
jgi:hypothetical protein